MDNDTNERSCSTEVDDHSKINMKKCNLFNNLARKKEKKNRIYASNLNVVRKKL